MEMGDIGSLLTELSAAVTEAKAKSEVVTTLRAELAAYVSQAKAELDAYVAEQQATINAAQAAYDDAKVATTRLQEQARVLIGDLLPTPDPRFRVST